MNNYITLGLLILAGLYIIATAIGNFAPQTSFGKFCLRVALIIGNIEKALPAVEKELPKP